MRHRLQTDATAAANSEVIPRPSVAFFCAALIASGTALLVPLVAAAQSCPGNTKNGCFNESAVCSPVRSGIGPTGRCTTTAGPPGERECVCVGAPAIDLTGRWLANDGGVYYLGQIGNELWWAGLSVESPEGASDLHKGLRFSNVFHGQLSLGSITGDWVDVPRGLALDSGTLTLSFTNNQILRQAATGGFAAAEWDRAQDSLPPPANNLFIFNRCTKTRMGGEITPCSTIWSRPKRNSSLSSAT